MQIKLFDYTIKIAKREDERWYDVIENDGPMDYHILSAWQGNKLTEYIIADEIDKDCNVYEHRDYIKSVMPGLTRISIKKLRKS